MNHVNSHFVHVCWLAQYTWCTAMSGTSAFPIVLDMDSEAEEVEEIEELMLKNLFKAHHHVLCIFAMVLYIFRYIVAVKA